MQVEGTTVLVTSASSGIGAALAPMLAERGATVGIVARRADRLAEVLDRCQVHAPASRMYVADLGDLDAAEALALRAWEEMGGLDGLVHNAAIVKEAAYCASKFALCGWSEAMAMDLLHTGVQVRLILPGAIATEIWDQPGNDDAVYEGPFEPPETVAAGIIDAIEGDTFELYVPDMRPIVEWKTAGGIDDFMAGAVAFADEQAKGR